MKILFISHESSRTGAPLVLLFLMNWIKETHPHVIIDFVTLKGGQLDQEFKESSNAYFDILEINQKDKLLKFNKKNKFYLRVLNKLFNHKSKETNYTKTIKELSGSEYDIIYANSIVSIPFAIEIKDKSARNPKVIAHIHELNLTINIFLPDFSTFIPKIDYFIAVSGIVKTNLTTNWNISENKIDIIYEMAKLQKNIGKKTNSKFIVGASGSAHWRKGDDVFIQVANYINKNYSSCGIKFVWVGETFYNKNIIESDIEKLGLKDKVQFVGEQKNPFSFYNDFDVFLLTSREDPFPLVCIEVASLEKPIICFEKASGSAEMIQKGGGFVVPYLDVEAMGEKIIFYYENRDIMKIDGEKARKIFSEFTPEIICPKIYNLILDVL